MKRRRCKNKDCRRLFVVSLRHPNQQYCSMKKCQRVRKTKWQRDKKASDEYYRMNQTDSNETWLENNPGYWKKYRKNNPGYTQRNREKQKERDQSKRDSKADASISENLAKMDVLSTENNIISGIYWLIPVDKNNLAKMDALTVKITEISMT